MELMVYCICLFGRDVFRIIEWQIPMCAPDKRAL